MKRAREPYRLRNAVTGTLLVAFAVSVWAYSISAVKQDNFDDIDAAALDQRRTVQTPTSAPTPMPMRSINFGSFLHRSCFSNLSLFYQHPGHPDDNSE